MPRRSKPPTVNRQYVPDPERCAAALVKLLFWEPSTQDTSPDRLEEEHEGDSAVQRVDQSDKVTPA